MVLDPASDWQAIDPWHTQIGELPRHRTGLQLGAPDQSRSLRGYYFQGRRLAAVDDFTSTGRAMVAEVPTRGSATLYARLGDWLPWACGVLLLILIVRAVRSRRK